MNKIKCQQNNCKENGCSTCSGYGYVLETSHTPCCNKETWIRPGNYTIYEGKRRRSFDGLELVVRNGESVCLECEK